MDDSGLLLDLRPGAPVGITIEKGRLVVQPQKRPQYTVEELLAQRRPKAGLRKPDREWLSGGPAGAEIL